jgi:uncharacterized protein (DUF305 family)
MTRSIHHGLWLKLLTTALAVGACAPTLADEPGRGLTAEFEKRYLRMIIDHHYSALRITELAAGTDQQRDDDISPMEGTSPTPRRPPVQAKAASDEIKSMARRNNRMQREEILTAQRFLRDWYGINYWPRLTPEGQAQITILEKASAGRAFDHLFLEVLSRHHYMALGPSTDCQVAVDLAHHELKRYCSGIVHSQINDIQDMREMLSKEFGYHDYQPLSGDRGRHSGN